MRSSLAPVEPPQRLTPGKEALLDVRSAILWSDADLVVVNKPAGLLTIADGYNPDLPHLAGLLQAYLGRVWVIHRLDKDTSGVILFALNADAHRALNTAFQNRETQKEYHAICLGVPDWQEKDINLPLKVNGDRSHRTVVETKEGKAAATTVKVLRTSPNFCYLSAYPHTGYTHQIRAHLSSIGLPLLQDPLYRSRLAETEQQKSGKAILSGLPIQRTALHAWQLTFTHPGTGEIITVQALEQKDFAETISILFSAEIK
jgi:tRNA pseudouridine32 synthase / 23S rRNA pseudouridine746 synthase